MESKGKKETLYSFFISVGSKFMAYLMLIVVANFFTKTDYGAATFVLAIFQLVLYLSVLGMPDVYVPWIVKKKDTSSIFYFLLILSLSLTLIGVLIALKYLWILPIVLTLPFILFLGISRAILRSEYKFHIATLFNFLLITITLIVAFLFKDFGKLGIISAYAIGYFLISISAFILARKKALKIISKVRLKLTEIKEYIKKSSVTFALLLSYAFLGWIDSTILGILSTFESVAKYNIALPISNVITMIPFSLSMFMLTRSAEVKDKTLSRSILNRTVRISFTLSFLIAFVLNALIFLFVRLFFPKYVGIEVFVMILSMGAIFYSIYAIIAPYLIGRLEPEKAAIPIITAAIINIVLDIILIPFLDVYAVVLATTIAHLVALLLFSYKLKLVERLKYALIFTIIFIPLGFYLKYYSLLLLIVIVPLLFYLKLITKEDINIMIKTVKNLFKNETTNTQ